MLPIAESAQEILNILNTQHQTLIDTPDTNTTYIGTAPFGTLTSAANWSIQKITTNCSLSTSGGAIVITAGAGTQTITQNSITGAAIWDNRASITYVS